MATGRHEYLPFPGNAWASLRARVSRSPDADGAVWLLEDRDGGRLLKLTPRQD